MNNAAEIQLLDKRVRLRQPAEGFRPGLDSVMLAAACPAQPGESILDLGCGVGSAGLCVLTRVADTRLTGIDINEDCITLAEENAALNTLDNRAGFSCTDIRNFESAPFDHVICNPPYLEAGNHLRSPDEQKALANGHEETSLEDWLRAVFNNLKSGGSLSLIHRADMADKIIQGLGKSYGAVEIIPLWPKKDTPAKRVIIRAVKDRKSPAVIHPGIILHEENGDYTKEAEKILRQAQAL